VELTRKADVHALNQIQYLSAAKNIYFRSWDDTERIRSEVGELAEIRDGVRAVSKMLVRDFSADGPGERYRRGSAEEEANARESIVMTLLSTTYATQLALAAEIPFQTEDVL